MDATNSKRDITHRDSSGSEISMVSLALGFRNERTWHACAGTSRPQAQARMLDLMYLALRGSSRMRVDFESRPGSECELCGGGAMLCSYSEPLEFMGGGPGFRVEHERE